MFRLTPPRFLARAVLILGCLYLGGCSTPTATPSGNNSDIVQLTSFWQPYLLYLLPSPHRRLYVEVDSIEGCEPSEAALKKLRDFLTATCAKPGGIEIVRSDVIPVKTARGIRRTALARKFLDGPPDDGASPPAFIYVLFYDGALCDQPPVAEAHQPGANTTTSPPERNKNPHVDFLPYPAVIFMNTRYPGPLARKLIRNEDLLHEAGHLLGLAARPAYASDYHCLDSSCRMNSVLRGHIKRLLLGRDPVTQRQLCPRCLAQLAESSKQPPPANLHFVGSVLVRSEPGYHVLSLPFNVKLVVGDLTGQDCRDFAAAVRAEITPPGGVDILRWDGQIKANVLSEPARMYDILNRALRDPYEPVRTTASKLKSSALPQ